MVGSRSKQKMCECFFNLGETSFIASHKRHLLSPCIRHTPLNNAPLVRVWYGTTTIPTVHTINHITMTNAITVETQAAMDVEELENLDVPTAQPTIVAEELAVGEILATEDLKEKSEDALDQTAIAEELTTEDPLQDNLENHSVQEDPEPVVEFEAVDTDLHSNPEVAPQVADAVPVTPPSILPDQPKGVKLLYKMAEEAKAFGVDESLLVDGLSIVPISPTSNGLQYTGPVGQAVRSFRTLQALQLPTPKSLDQIKHMEKEQGHKWTAFLHKKGHSSVHWQPFVAPFLLPGGESLSFTPRLVSYYEVLILPAQSETTEAESETESKDDACIAVGLALDDFPLEESMPGWTKRSYGYHSDDGAVFYSGAKKPGRLPPFKVGDKVGCGIDYRNSCVFYTLNGEFLGYSVQLKSSYISKQWYPTVGIDACACVVCNFGMDDAFAFDLQAFCEQDVDALIKGN